MKENIFYENTQLSYKKNNPLNIQNPRTFTYGLESFGYKASPKWKFYTQ